MMGLGPGADQIGYWLQDHPDRWDSVQPLPSRATINRILERRGMIVAIPQRRPRRSWRRFEAEASNTRWQMDGFEWDLADGHTVVVLELLDDCSRYDLALTAVRSENSLDVWNTVAGALSEHGIPRLFLTITAARSPDAAAAGPADWRRT